MNFLEASFSRRGVIAANWLLMMYLLALSFGGCTTSKNSLIIDASRPVYFGNMPKSLTATESATPEFLESIVASTSHVSAKERVVTGENVSFFVSGVEETRGNIVFHVERAFEDDPDRLISDVVVNAKVEAYIPWYSILSDVLLTMILGKTESSGAGEATQETIEFEGKIYTMRKMKP